MLTALMGTLVARILLSPSQGASSTLESLSHDLSGPRVRSRVDFPQCFHGHHCVDLSGRYG